MMNFENLNVKKNAVFYVICNCLPASISGCSLVKHSLAAVEAVQGQQGAQVLPYLLTTLFPEIIFFGKTTSHPIFFVLLLLNCCRKIVRKDFVTSKPLSLTTTPPVCVG